MSGTKPRAAPNVPENGVQNGNRDVNQPREPFTVRDRDAEGQVDGHDAPCGAGGEMEPIAAALRDVTLDLLASLPERPQRLRLQAGSVSIDVDWRLPHAPGHSAVSPVLSPAVVPPAAADSAVPGNGLGTPSPPEAPAGTELHYICAHSVGTFYHAPEPGAAPFVTEGALVRPGQQVGILEAMKLMLPVESDQAGRVVEVLVADSQPVEYQERLIALALDG